jgi:hypothetical protein
MPGEEIEGTESSEEETEDVETEEVDTNLEADGDDESPEGDLSDAGGSADVAPAPQYFTVEQATKMFTQMQEHNANMLRQFAQQRYQNMNPPQQQPRPQDEGLRFPTQEEIASWGAGEWMNHMRAMHEYHDKRFQTLSQKLEYQTRNMTQSQKVAEVRSQLERETMSAIEGMDTFLDDETGKPDEEMLNILRITVAQDMQKNGLNVNIRKLAEAIHNKVHGKVDRRYKKKIGGKIGRKATPPPKGTGSKPVKDTALTLDEAKKGFAAAIRAQGQE